MKILLILALILRVNGYEVPAEGMDTVITDAPINPLTGKPLMSLDGSLETSNPLTVTITRSQEGLNDEFCCAGKCTAGNKQTSEFLSFTPGGETTWFVHYTPTPSSDVQVTYLFSDGVDSRELRVHYTYKGQGVETITNHLSPITRKYIRNGILYIEYNNSIYHL